VEIGGEQVRRIERSLAEIFPRSGNDLGVDLVLPEHLERLAWRVVIEAGKPYERGVPRLRSIDALNYEILSGTNANETALGRRRWQEIRH
jgi:hypothetical protein